MRVSIVNCVSTAADMMRFSDSSLFQHAGTHNFDYVIVKWLASPDVEAYLRELPVIVAAQCDGVEVHVIEHETDHSVGYVPNLRAMMNRGFNYGFRLNMYAGLVNTDCYFGPGWLKNLVRYAQPNRVINSLHITAATAPRPVRGIITEDLGAPLPGVFKGNRFVTLYDQNYRENLILASELNGPSGYRECATMPYLFHWQYWDACGPWELECVDGQSPDVRFFDRIAARGAEFALTDSSIVYHAEAIERRGKRPAGAEDLDEE